MLGEQLLPPASTRSNYGPGAPQAEPDPGNPLKKAAILALLVLSSGLLLILPDADDESYALNAGPGGEALSDESNGLDLIDDSALGGAADAAKQSPPSSITRVAGETGFSSEADTARLALATEAALAEMDPTLAGNEFAVSMAAEIASIEEALAALSPTTTAAPTTAPATTASPTTESPTTGAPETTVGETTASETAAEGTSESDASEAGSEDAQSTDTSTPDSGPGETVTSETTPSETGAGETTTPETTTPESTTPDTTTPETTTPETTTPETTIPETTTADGWVDTGNGVLVPPVLIEIRWCESRGDYTAANPSSSARGGYQFLTGSWKAYGHKDRYGVSQAHLATPAQQDEAALITWERDGTRPWNASKSCWSKRI